MTLSATTRCLAVLGALAGFTIGLVAAQQRGGTSADVHIRAGGGGPRGLRRQLLGLPPA